MTTLVTGATGFVGSHVARQLLAAGHSVRVLVRPTSNLKSLDGLAVDRVEGDLRDVISLDRAMKGVRWVFHVAADYRLWARDPRGHLRSNVDGTRRLFEVAAQNGVERVVYTSTVATVAVPLHGHDLPNEETHAAFDQMIGHYKRSKFLAEIEAIKAAGQGIPVVIVNPTAPVGSRRLEAHPDRQDHRRFSQRENARLRGHRAQPRSRWKTSPPAICSLRPKGRIGERYILGARNMTLREILQALAKITGRPAPQRASAACRRAGRGLLR